MSTPDPHPPGPVPRSERTWANAPGWLPIAAGLTLLVAAYHADVVVGGRRFVGRDLHTYWLQQAESFVRCLAAGSWPLWDPWRGFGQPLLANPDAQVLYPPTWLHPLMQPGTQYVFFVLGHRVFAGLGMWLLARQCGVSRLGAIVAALSWTLSGPFVSLVAAWNHLAAAAWIPWVLLLGEAALARARSREAVLFAAALATQVLAGSPDVTVMTTLLCLPMMAAAIRRTPAEAPRRLATATGVLVLAAALSAAQWLPSLTLLARAGVVSFEAETQDAAPSAPAVLAQAIVPLWDTESLPVAPATGEARAPFLSSPYLGLSAFALVAMGALAGRGPRRRWAATAVVAMLWAAGREGPLQPRLGALPPLSWLRHPEEAMVVAGLAWALLAGLGVDAWRRAGLPARRRLTAAAGALAVSILAMTFLAHVIARSAPGALYTADRVAWAGELAAVVAVALASGGRRAGLVIALAIAVDLFTLNQGANPTAAREVLAFRPPVLEALAGIAPARVYVYDYERAPGKSRQYLGRDAPYATHRSTAERQASLDRAYLLSPLAGAFGHYGSYDLGPAGLDPAAVARLGTSLRDAERTPMHDRLLRLGAVARVVTRHREGLERLVLMGSVAQPFPEQVVVYSVPDTRPRAYLVGGTRVGGWDALADPAFDEKQEVVLGGGTPRTAPPGYTGVVRSLLLRPDRVDAEVESSHPGYLVLVDAWDPDWRAEVDGQAVTLERANLAFRAVPVLAGRHRVSLLYRPPSVVAGLAASVAGLVLAALALVRGRTEEGSGAGFGQ